MDRRKVQVVDHLYEIKVKLKKNYTRKSDI